MPSVSPRLDMAVSGLDASAAELAAVGPSTPAAIEVERERAADADAEPESEPEPEPEAELLLRPEFERRSGDLSCAEGDEADWRDVPLTMVAMGESMEGWAETPLLLVLVLVREAFPLSLLPCIGLPGGETASPAFRLPCRLLCWPPPPSPFC